MRRHPFKVHFGHIQVKILQFVQIDRMVKMPMVPAGIPHGPHPGTVEKSIGKKETKELAVMVDTFHPLMITKQAIEIENIGYVNSWHESLD